MVMLNATSVMMAIAALAAAAYGPFACTTFAASDPSGDGGVEGGDDGGPGPEADGARPDAPTNDAAADGDARTPNCTTFDEGFTSGTMGWLLDSTTGGTLGVSKFDGLTSLDGVVTGSGQREGVLRGIVPTQHFSVEAQLVLTSGPSAAAGWTVDVISLVCMTPESKIVLEYVPDGVLAAEALPSAVGAGVDSFGAPSATWSTVKLEVIDRLATFTVGTQTKSVELAGSAPLVGAINCRLAVGANANANVPTTHVHVRRVCLSGL